MRFKIFMLCGLGTGYWLRPGGLNDSILIKLDGPLVKSSKVVNFVAIDKSFSLS